MSLPREGSRTIGEGIIVSEAMDWCRSPTAIVPYKIYTHHQVEGASTADSVRQTDERSHVQGSLIRQCYGDEPGVGGGVRSGTRGAECEPKTWSSSVRFEGRNVVRHDDEWWMNHKNTYGRLTYVKDPKTYDTPEDKQIAPRMPGASGQSGETAGDAGPEPVRPGAQYAQLAIPVPRPVPVPVPPISQEQSTKAADALWKGIKGLKPEDGETFSDYMQRPLYNLGIKKNDDGKTQSKDKNLRVSRDDENKNCPPCRTASGKIVHPGTIGYRLDLVPPSKPHWPLPGDHYNLYKAHQIPWPKCDCFWRPLPKLSVDARGGLPPPAGSIPVESFVK